jgi:hypothetical protein
MTTSTLLTSIGSSVAGFDVFIIGALLLGSILYGISLGRDRISGILLASYVAFAVAVNVSYLETAARALHVPDTYAKLVVFLVIFALTFFQFFRRSLMSALGSSSRWWQTSVLSVLQVGLLVSLTLTLLPPEMASGLSGLTKTIFLGDAGRSLWLTIPLLAMLFLPNG